jgi:uncharacterized hydrophobic protein (TIGR00271 family)
VADADDLTSELEDSDDALAAGYDLARVDFARLLSPNAIRRMLGIVVALMVMFWPQRSDAVLGRLVGIGLIGYGVVTLWSLRRVRPVPWFVAGVSLVVTALGAAMVAFPVQTEVALGRIFGLALIAGGIAKLFESPGQNEPIDVRWRWTSAFSVMAVGVLVALFPSELLSALTVSLAILWVAFELLSLSVLLNPDRDADAPRTPTTELVGQWFADRPKAVDDRQRLYRELLYEGDGTRAKITRFLTLMVLASVIASMGVVADSTAVVVGAMLIAPLMNPLMGMALSLVMGWPNRLARSSLIALAGIVIAIGVGTAVGLADFAIVDTLTNGQIVSRSNPTIVDLVIAVAAGAAGAYGWSRPDVSNALPGVAVAIALVPPLTVIGISYSQGDWESGSGALLLFATNAIAILVVGAAVFVLTGVAPLTRASENQDRVRTSLAAVGGAAAIITAAVVLNGTTVATNVFEQNAASRVVSSWLESFPDHTTVAVSVTGDTVSVVLAGPVLEQSPSADALATDLGAELGREITVDLRIRLESRDVSGE